MRQFELAIGSKLDNFIVIIVLLTTENHHDINNQINSID